MNRWLKGGLFLATALIVGRLCWDLTVVYDSIDRDPDTLNLAYLLAFCQPVLNLVAAYLVYAGLSVLITGKVRRMLG